MLRIPHCLDNRLIDGGKVVSPTHPPHFTPQKRYYFQVILNTSHHLLNVLLQLADKLDLLKKCFWYSFLLEAE
jgi:hypothetical protein